MRESIKSSRFWKRLLSGVMTIVMLVTILPTAAYAAVGELLDLSSVQRTALLSALDETVASVQAMIDALPTGNEITEDNAEEVKEQLEAIDEAKAQLSDEEIDELDFSRYIEAVTALEQLLYNGDYKTDYASDFENIDLTVGDQEQFSLTPGGRYYFDLSAMNIPGTVNTSLPGRSLHWVPFTYVGTINAYSRNSEGVSTDGAVSPYDHSLFIADYNVTFKVSWDGLNEKQMIFGTPYTSYGVNYTMRAPSVGSNKTGSGSSEHGAPQSNEWDKILDKGSDYIKNWSLMYSWGQDNTTDASNRAVRGYNSARRWGYSNATTNSLIYLGFRPVFELPDTLSSDSLKVVTLNLNGGKLGKSTDAIQIIVKNSSTFTAPVSDGLTRPDGNTGNYFMWLDGNGNSYEPGGSVPADVTELTVQWTAPTYTVTLHTNGGTINNGDVTEYTYGVGATLPTAGNMTYTGHTFKGWYDNEGLSGDPVTAIGDTETGNKEYWAKWEANGHQEQFSLTPGGTYWFDLSGMEIPGTKNASLPGRSLRWVPFTYVGTINAYKLESAQVTTKDYAEKNAYDHSLFIADYAVTHTVSWDELNNKSLIFGKDYQSGGVSYTLRAPSAGSNYTGVGGARRGTPQNNEWDAILDKDSRYIKNGSVIYSWGQDTYVDASRRAVRGYNSVFYWDGNFPANSASNFGFRPVLEILNPGTLGSNGLKVVTLELGGGKLGGSSDAIQIIVKTGESFTAPVSDGLTRPDGVSGNFFMWLGSDGKLYAPGVNVPAEVTKLTAQFTNTYTVTLHTNGGTIAEEKNVNEYTYGVGATLPTANDMTYTGYTFNGWYDNENLTGSPVTAIGNTETGNKAYWAKWEANGSQEQFSLTPGGRYYFDLSAMDIPGTVNGSLPGRSLRWVPFTYVGTINAYSRNSAGVKVEPYDHSLFIADYAVTHTVSWSTLKGASLIFGKDYAAGGVSYTLRAPSAGSNYTGSGISTRGMPQSNEWDAILDKANQGYQDNTSGYIKNWDKMYSHGQDTYSINNSQHAVRGYDSARGWINRDNAAYSLPSGGFRPVLEVLHADTLGSNALKAVALDLNGGSIGDATGTVNIVVKNGESFTAPSGVGLTRPSGNTDSYFWWLGSDGESYVPGAMIPAGVASLTAQWTALTYAVTLNTNGGTIADGKNVTSYTYGVGTKLPTADDMTYAGHTFKGWYEDSDFSGEPVTEISTTATGAKTYYAKWLSTDAGITAVSVDNTAGTINGTTITVVLPYGTVALPTENSKVSITAAAGATVSGLTTADGSAWTFTVTAADGQTTAGYTISVSIAPDPATGNRSDIAAAKSTVENHDWTVPQATANTEEAVKTWIEGQLAAMNLNGASYTVTMTGFTAATEGTAADRDGTNGSFTFTVKLYKGDDTGNIETSTYAEDTVTISDGTVTATPYTKWAVTVNAEDGGSVSGGGTFEENTQVTVTATPNSGYHFVRWTENGVEVSTSASYSFTLTADRTLTAVFSRNSSGGGGGGSSSPSYTVSTDKDTENGSYTVRPSRAERGDTVTITTKPDEGYQVGKVTVTDKNGDTIKVTDKGDGKYTFTMPDGKVSVDVTFVPETGEWVNPFVDVPDNAWYYDGMKFVYENGLMAGTSGNTFSPNVTTTRGMLVTILYRLAGSPNIEDEIWGYPFQDVDANAYYAAAVYWARMNGIVAGYSDERFGPSDTITREQMATILYRYAQYKGYATTDKANLSKYTDAAQVGSYAVEAIRWANAEGLVNGTSSTTLTPKGSATRAQVAVILTRFCQNIAK